MVIKEQLLCDLLTRQARLRPTCLAIVGDEQQLTYEQLERQSNSLAWALREAACRER